MQSPKSLTNGNLIENAKVFAISFIPSEDESVKHRVVKVSEESSLVSDVLKKHRGEFGSLCFVIRRPG